MSLGLIPTFSHRYFTANIPSVSEEVAVNMAGSKSRFYLLALCVFISWSYAALILSLGPTTAIDVFGLPVIRLLWLYRHELFVGCRRGAVDAPAF